MSNKYASFIAGGSNTENVVLNKNVIITLNVCEQNNNTVSVVENFCMSLQQTGLSDVNAVQLFHDLQMYHFEKIIESVSIDMVIQARG
jgi:hypothetical protein